MNSCSSCGIDIPEEQRSCSMCYGDPYYGKDGYYLAFLEQQAQEDDEKHQWEDKAQEELEKQYQEKHEGDLPF